jgi:hypothetical protein
MLKFANIFAKKIENSDKNRIKIKEVKKHT